MLPRIVGLQNALEILLTNAVMSAEEAVELGFVRRVWSVEGFAARVHEFARGMAQHCSPASLAVMKRQLYVDAYGDLETAYLRSVDDMNRMMGERDFSEGLSALRRRHMPVFRPHDASSSDV
jgi:enoyl-CoA hydratase/carnithine racemase